VQSRTDFIRAGQQLLRDGGVRAVKLRELTRALGVTTGSFYHHFDNFDVYLGELAAEFALAGEPIAAVLAQLQPAERVRTLLSIRAESDVPALDRAMRIWAAGDARARDAVERLDHALLKLIEAAFVDLGFDPGESRMRARTAYAAGIGLGMMSAPWPIGADEEDRAVVLFLG
jgi:AcrR family transcriptional regulator